MFRSIGDLAVSVMLGFADGMHGGAEGKPLNAVLTPAAEGAPPATRNGKEAGPKPRQFHGDVVKRNSLPLVRETYGKPMLTALTGGQVHRHSKPHEARPASAMAIHLITVDGVRVGHAFTPVGSSR